MKVEYVIDFEDKAPNDAVCKASYNIPDEARSLKMEAWPLKDQPKPRKRKKAKRARS